MSAKQDSDRTRPARIQRHRPTPDNALGSLGEIVRQCFVKLAIPTQSLLQLLVLLGKKNGGSRTNGMSISLVSGTLHSRVIQHSAHVARAMGIELAHSEGQYVIHFLWDMRKFYDSIKAHLLLVARGYPPRNTGSGHPNTQITEMSSSW